MQELAEHGAKVLNAQAVEWAKKAGIVIYARATTSAAGPEGSAGQETRVGGEVVRERRGAVAVTGTRRITIVSGDVLSIVEGEGIALRHAGPRGVRFVHDDVPDWPRVEKRLRDGGAAIEERGEVTVVGAGVGSDAATVRRALAAAGQVHDWDASPLRLTLTVDSERTDEVTRALHAALISDG